MFLSKMLGVIAAESDSIAVSAVRLLYLSLSFCCLLHLEYLVGYFSVVFLVQLYSRKCSRLAPDVNACLD